MFFRPSFSFLCRITSANKNTLFSSEFIHLFSVQDKRLFLCQLNEKFYSQTHASEEQMQKELAIKRDELNQVQLLLKEINNNKNTFSINDIESIKNKILAAGFSITKVNFDAMFIGFCGKENAFALGKEYFKSLYEKGDCKLGVIGKFFRLCYDCKKECTEEDKIFMLHIYKEILGKYEILDFRTCENIVLGLSITNYWKECFSLLEMCLFSSKPSSKMYSVIIETCFNKGDITAGWKLLYEMGDNRKAPLPEVYYSWLNASGFTRDSFLKILHYFEKYNIHPSHDVAALFLSSEGRNKIKQAVMTSVNYRGQCKACYKTLTPLTINEDEFQELKNAFLNPVLIGNDIFLKTKPNELNSYIKYLDEIGHIDFVIDGLNIALSPIHRTYNPVLSSKVLSDTVKYFVERQKKVLVLGRMHMAAWPKGNMNYIKKNAFLFLVENLTADDPFLLYAAMYKGLGTCFVSRDQMRGHKFLLKNPKLEFAFSKWQQKHHYYFVYAQKNGNIVLKEPIPYLQNVHETKPGVWHIPISSDLSGVPAHLVPNKREWLCVRL